MAKYTALDIANFFVGLANSIPNEQIDNLKLNKLCYYAQAWSLARLGEPLFDDAIEAWRYGPLIPCVYHTYKLCGDNPIKAPSYEFKESLFSSEELSLLTDVYITYGKYTSRALIDRTHLPGSPWSQVYEEMQNNEISLDSMRSYFEHGHELETMELNLTEDNVVSYA